MMVRFQVPTPDRGTQFVDYSAMPGVPHPGDLVEFSRHGDLYVVDEVIWTPGDHQFDALITTTLKAAEQ